MNYENYMSTVFPFFYIAIPNLSIKNMHYLKQMRKKIGELKKINGIDTRQSRNFTLCFLLHVLIDLINE
jgi:hypothetical protein